MCIEIHSTSAAQTYFWNPGPVFTKRTDVLPHDLVNEVSKPQDSDLDFSNRSWIWQAPRQPCCGDARQIPQWCHHYHIQSRVFETSRDLVVREVLCLWSQCRKFLFDRVRQYLLNVFGCSTCEHLTGPVKLKSDSPIGPVNIFLSF